MKTRFAQEIAFKEIKQRIFPNQSATFAKCFNWLMRREELTPGAKLLYSRLVQYAGIKNYSRVKQATLALELGLGLRQVQRYIEELAHFHLIEIQQLGLNKANLYYFLQHPWMTQTNQTSTEKQLHPIVNKEDSKNMEVTYVSHQEVSDLSSQEVTDPTPQEVPDLSLPLNRSSEKIPLKEHTQKKERVCVLSPPEVSAYSEEQWFYYAERQKNINSASALANSLARSKKNDHLMRKFLEGLEKEKENATKRVLEAQTHALELDREKYILVQRLLALNEPLLDWQIQFVQANQHLLSQQQVC